MELANDAWRAWCTRVAASTIALIGWLSIPPFLAAQSPDVQRQAVDAAPIRCAVNGSMLDTQFWPQLAERFKRHSGIPVEVVATGPKQELAAAFAQGDADLITMHAGDTMINLVADWYARDLQPWARNDFLLIGPASDPAGIQGEPNAVAALEKLIAGKAPILIHSSNGASEVLRDLLAEGELELDAVHTVTLPSERHRTMLTQAAKRQAYTLVGRIPFLSGKVPHEGLAIMVQGDRRLRRPYVVATGTADRIGPQRFAAARRLAQWLRAPDTQEWIAQFGQGVLDDRPLFFPVVIPDLGLSFVDLEGNTENSPLTDGHSASAGTDTR